MSRIWRMGLLSGAVVSAAVFWSASYGADTKVPAAEAGGAIKVRMAMVPLPPNVIVYSPNEANPRYLSSAATPVPAPATGANFAKSDSADLVLGSTTFRLVRRNGNFALTTEKGSVNLTRKDEIGRAHV